MTPESGKSPCVLCGEPATDLIDPPRRTLARGLDPGDPSYSVTVILPDVALCAEHAFDVRHGGLFVGWCDDPRCRTFGELGVISTCGHPYEKLTHSKRP
jgi:hypothetical protein